MGSNDCRPYVGITFFFLPLIQKAGYFFCTQLIRH